MDFVIELSGISYSYPGRENQPVLKDINLKVRRGEFIVVTGRTGSGKSTLCYILNGLIPHFFGGVLQGTARVAGLEVAKATITDLASRVGIVFQNAESQLVGLTVEEDIQFGLENLCLPPAVILERSRWAMAVTGLAGLEGRSPWRLSGGQKQRTVIAAALAMYPEVLVLDNPTAELDPLGKAEVLAVIERLNKEMGLTVVLCEQDLERSASLADRIVVLDAGRIILDDQPEAIFDNAETLQRLGLRLPQVTDLALRLRASGKWTGPLPVSVTGFLSNLPPKVQCITSTVNYGGEPLSKSAEKVSTNTAKIIVDNVSHIYPDGTKALDGVSLRVFQGEILAILGHNGSGKTTLAKHFNGLLRPTTGRVLVDGIDTKNATVAQLANRVGYVFQNPDHQIFAKTVAEELAFGPRNLGWPEEQVQEAVEVVLKEFNLQKYREKDPFFLGLAERKLLAIASILIMKPQILVLDEPATGADYTINTRIIDYIQELNKKGMTIVVITHDVEAAAGYAHRLVVMKSGQVVLAGEPGFVFRHEELLRQCYIEAPPVTKIGQELNRVGWQGDMYTVEQAYATLARLL
ncbi:energy-coupling factor transport system ATP-binding protein [Thermanaeromonas toyohensis ToBE]|uniref:Energy-coupling factor transport system ATP-binding protein n=1 Tax=Thermanaeromonas toyohensis ToBE TaxID=698762 RepID=A0A1W1V9U2_9FIRM|nr:energy-coupling factor transporter ATPase [Thermanaeromonas toyohensis]SMB89801.1 energy-coupling factor transport system ATP-binding protein [Thermanaeromonas toyohensis ToBE]